MRTRVIYFEPVSFRLSLLINNDVFNVWIKRHFTPVYDKFYEKEQKGAPVSNSRDDSI